MPKFDLSKYSPPKRRVVLEPAPGRMATFTEEQLRVKVEIIDIVEVNGKEMFHLEIKEVIQTPATVAKKAICEDDFFHSLEELEEMAEVEEERWKSWVPGKEFVVTKTIGDTSFYHGMWRLLNVHEKRAAV